MEKIDLIRQQDSKQFAFVSPDTDSMSPLRVDSRTTFYFRTPEKREDFIKKRLKKHSINL